MSRIFSACAVSVIFAFAFLNISYSLSYAQGSQGPAITVVVKDPSGGTVDNAVVVLSMGTTERRGTTAAGLDGPGRSTVGERAGPRPAEVPHPSRLRRRPRG